MEPLRHDENSEPRRKEEATSDSEDGLSEATEDGGGALSASRSDRMRTKVAAARASMKSASVRHVSVAVPLRAAERNRRVASSVLAGGIAYRLFLWLLPFGLILGGTLGLMDADGTEEAVDGGGLPAAVVNAIGDAARAADSDSWWLLVVGVAGLLFAGHTGAKAVQLIHSLVWDRPPPQTNPLKGSLAFTGIVCAFMAAIALTQWLREETWFAGVLAATLTIAVLAGLWLWVSVHLPHRDAPWKALLPGALLVAIGFQLLHQLIESFLEPKLEKSTSLYGALGAVTTLLFFMYIVGSLIVAAPVLNSSLYHELRMRGDKARDDGTSSPEGASPG